MTNGTESDVQQSSPPSCSESPSPQSPTMFAMERRPTEVVRVHQPRYVLWAAVAFTLAIGVIVGPWLYERWRSDTILAVESQCAAYSRRSQWSELAQASHRWSMMEPGRAEPWLYQAEAAEAIEDWRRVVECLARIPRTDRRAAAALARKASVEFEQLNRPWDTLRTCDELLVLEPKALIAHKLPLFICASMLQRVEMVRRIRVAIRARRESPESYVYLAGSSWIVGAAIYHRNNHWLEADPENETFQVARAMQIYMSEAKSLPDEMVKYEHIPPPEDLLRRFPHNLELLTYLLNQAMVDGDVARVDELLTAVPKIAGDQDARIWRVRSWRADIEGDLRLAEKCARRAYAIDPYWWRTHHQLQDLSRRLGQMDESERFAKIYAVSLLVGKAIMGMKSATDGFDDSEFRSNLLNLAELVDDQEVVEGLRERSAAK